MARCESRATGRASRSAPSHARHSREPRLLEQVQPGAPRVRQQRRVRLHLGCQRDLQPQLLCHDRTQRRRRPLPDNPSAVDDRKPVDDALGLRQVVSDEQHRRAVPAEVGDGVPQHLPPDRIDVVRRLVEHEQVRLAHDRRGEACQPPHAARSGVHHRLPERLQVEPRDYLVGTAPRVAPAVAAQPRNRVDQFVHVHRLQVELALRQEPDAPPREPGIRHHVHALDRNGAGGRLEQPQHLPHQRRLPGAVRAEQSVHLARPQRQRDVVVREGSVAVPLSQPTDLEDGLPAER